MLCIAYTLLAAPFEQKALKYTSIKFK